MLRVLCIEVGRDGFLAFLFAGILDCDVLEFRSVVSAGFLRVLLITEETSSPDLPGLACAAAILALLLAEEFSRDVLTRLVLAMVSPVPAPLSLRAPVENPASLSSRLEALPSSESRRPCQFP